MKKKYGKVCISAIFLVLLSFFGLPLCACGDPAGPDLEVYFFSIGKADAFLLTSGGRTVLIDTGCKSDAKGILAELENRDITRIDVLIITHFDKDHAGGAAKIIEKTDIGAVLQTAHTEDNEACARYAEALETVGITPMIIAGEDYTFSLGSTAFTVNPPARETYEKNPDNNSSLIVTAECGGRRLLFAGDAENARLEEFIAADPGDYDFVKIPYHGHWQKRLDDLILAVRPKYAVITSSDDEPEDPDTLELLTACDVEYWLTREGAVTLTVTDGVIEITQE